MKKLLFLIFLLFSKLAFSIDIDDAIKSTIENNPKVRIAYEKLTESKELIENAYNQKLPTITSTISGTYSTSDSSTSRVKRYPPEKSVILCKPSFLSQTSLPEHWIWIGS